MKLAVFGSPVAHSLSPAMHRAALAHVGIRGDYEPFDVDGAGFESGVAALRDGRLDGANVTMPHKPLAYRLCDVRSERSERAGAVNTLYCREGVLIGENTDVDGIRAAWLWNGLPADGIVTILGAGGAAAGALVALEGRHIHVMARSVDKARALIDRTGVNASARAWGSPAPGSIVVNATPIGMGGEELAPPVLEEAAGLLDMAYGDRETAAVERMRRWGRPVAAGLDLLIGQAVVSFWIWTGESVDPDVMRSAAEAELARRRAGRQ